MYRTKIEVTVLSEEPIPEDMDIGDVLREADSGDFVMAAYWTAPELLTKPEMAAALIAAGSEPLFFQIESPKEGPR